MQVQDCVVVFPDLHFPLHDEKALKCALKVLKAVKPSAFLCLGDVAEGEFVSHWRWKKKKRPPLEYQLPDIDKEIKEVNGLFDRIDEECDKLNIKKKMFTQGNHEKWYDYFVEENPYLESYTSRKAFRIDERGYDWYDYGVEFKVLKSKLYAYHGGHWGGINHTRSHVQNLGANIIYGHTHDAIKSVVSHLDGPKMAHSMGCLCDMNKEFLKNRSTNWTHNVGIVDIFSDGSFNLNLLTILDGITSINGKLIKG